MPRLPKAPPFYLPRAPHPPPPLLGSHEEDSRTTRAESHKEVCKCKTDLFTLFKNADYKYLITYFMSNSTVTDN